MKLRTFVFIPLATLGLSSCLIESSQPKPDNGENPLGLVSTGPARHLSKQTYDALSPMQQYQVANKLLGSLYKGVSAREFFDMNAGFSNPQALGRDILGEAQSAIKEPMPSTDFTAAAANIEAKYLGSANTNTRAYAAPLAYMYGLPLSKDHFARWVAYQLVNNILFSPAGELDSVVPIDIDIVYNRLVAGIDAQREIGDIVYDHMLSQENWRRFRSPEDNVREMAEIYLLRFVDDEVPRAAKACKNWHLTDAANNYRLVIDANVNREPVPNVLGTNAIISCYDFYKRVATHPALIPTVAARVVDQFFPDYSTAERAAMVNGILSSHPTRFDQIYATVIFSEEYLLRVARLKNAEEALFNAAARLKWAPRETTTGNPGSSTFTDLNNENSSTLSTMGQAAMRYKLGRLFKVPTDTLSFAYYHSALRGAMIAIRGTATDGRAGWIAELYDSPGMSAMTLDNYIRYAFITAAQRQPTDGDSSLVGTAELPTLKKLCTDLNYVNISSVGVRQNIARLIFDYVSRLPETYAYNR